MSNMASKVCVHPDLQLERDQANFDLEQLTYIFDGSREVTQKRRYLGAYGEYLPLSCSKYRCRWCIGRQHGPWHGHGRARWRDLNPVSLSRATSRRLIKKIQIQDIDCNSKVHIILYTCR